LFPITLNYFSPYIIIDGASQGIITGSFIVFALLFLSSLFLGRLWCAWLCPGGGLQEACLAVNARPARGGKLDWIKWAIWIPWVGIIAVTAVSAGGYHAVDLFHMTESGITIDEPSRYVMYYIVVGVFVTLALATGLRGGCHYICWMAPFMIIGRTLRNLVRWPALRLKADRDKCTDCKSCTANCPMSLDVNGMVQRGYMENRECILCGSCADICPKDVITYSFRAG
jgi:ferredoxin-type protein NapH